MHGRQFCMRWIIREWPRPSADGLGPPMAPNRAALRPPALTIAITTASGATVTTTIAVAMGPMRTTSHGRLPQRLSLHEQGRGMHDKGLQARTRPRPADVGLYTKWKGAWATWLGSSFRQWMTGNIKEHVSRTARIRFEDQTTWLEEQRLKMVRARVVLEEETATHLKQLERALEGSLARR